MPTALFITREDLVRYTNLNGNVDTDKFLGYIKIAQEIHIQNYLGTKLYERIETDVLAGALAGNYLSLVQNYVQPMLIHFAMVEYLPFAAYQMSNSGIYRTTNEKGNPLDKEEVDFLISKENNLAQYYVGRFLDYMSFNAATLFPEYYTNTNDDVWPDKSNRFIGWVL